MRFSQILSSAKSRLTAGVDTVLTTTLDALAPQRCVFCDQLTQKDIGLCEYCEAALTPNTAACSHCALPDTRSELCPVCLDDSKRGPRVIAPFVYDPLMASLVQRWKYSKERRLAKTAAYLSLISLNDTVSYDIVLATPLHWRRQLERGFNQAEDLLLELRLGAPAHFPPQKGQLGLQRIRTAPPQATADRGRRSRQVRNVFQARGDFRGFRVLLIDDVCTTGATARSMARALTEAGAESVSLLCLARTAAPASALPPRIRDPDLQWRDALGSRPHPPFACDPSPMAGAMEIAGPELGGSLTEGHRESPLDSPRDSPRTAPCDSARIRPHWSNGPGQRGP